MISGPPGAGKTTKALEVVDEFHAIRFSPDEWMQASGISLRDSRARELIENTQLKIGLNLLKSNRDVVIEWGTWSRTERLTIVEAVTALGHQVWGYFLLPNLEELILRAERRDRKYPPGDRLSRSEIEVNLESFQTPESDELAMYSRYWLEK